MWQCADGRSERSPLNKVEMLAKRVAGHARASLPPSLPDIHFVLGLLLFSNPQAHLRINDPHRNGRIMRLADAADALLEQDAQGGVDLRPHRQGLLRIFAGLAPRPPVPQAIQDYLIDEVEPSREGVLKLAAKLQNQRYHCSPKSWLRPVSISANQMPSSLLLASWVIISRRPVARRRPMAIMSRPPTRLTVWR